MKRILIPTAIRCDDRPGHYWPAMRVKGESARQPVWPTAEPSLRLAVQRARERIAVIHPGARIAE